jgi:nucleoside-diphosphate-sugar epimerase
MATKPRIAVIGADGFVGGGLAERFNAQRIVYGPARDGDVPVSQAEQVIRNADIVINAGGFRVRPGCTYADYQRSHQGATSVFVPWIRPGALFLHISSASVLGKSKTQSLGNRATPNPRTFPSAAYALAKLEADEYLKAERLKRGFRLMFLRPAVVYSPQGAGMVGTVLKLAKRGVNLRLYPRRARHHFCDMNLLVEVASRVVERSDQLPDLSSFVVADPYTVTNRELDAIIHEYVPRKGMPVPIPVSVLSSLLGCTFHSVNPKLDLRTWGEIFGVLDLDTAYDPSDTFRDLDIDPAQYSLDRTLLPLVQRTLQQ